MDREPCSSHRTPAEAGWPVFLTVETALLVLQEQGYRPIVRVHHIHAIEATSDDERHICLLADLSELTAADFRFRVAETFRSPGYTHLPSGLRSVTC